MFLLQCLLTAILFLLTAVFCFLKWKYSLWIRRGVPHEEPHLIWGNLKGIRKTVSLSDIVQRIYANNGGSSAISGLYFFFKPVTIICDLDLIKQVLIKDFHQFSDRGTSFNEKHDPLSANLFNLREDRWKFLRSKITPTFSSGKLRLMAPIIAQLGDKLLSKLEESRGENVNTGNVFARYTTDVIGNCAFGLDCNSLDDPESEFLKMGNMVFHPRQSSVVKRFLLLFFGGLAAKLGIITTQSEVHSFFYDLARQCIEYREKERVDREDFLSSLLQMKAKSELTFDEVAAQMFLFQMAGYETSSLTLTYAGYELTRNQEVQQKAREEVKQVMAKYNDEFSFEAIFHMNYLDCVVNEALRKYPPAHTNFRRVTVDEYQIPGTEIYLKKDELVAVPIMAIQRNPAIFKDPELFDPDRFLPEHVQRRHAMAFLPWGDGPRICLGMRFAVMEIKLALAKILMSYRMEKGEGFPAKLEFMKSGITLSPNCDINVKFIKL